MAQTRLVSDQDVNEALDFLRNSAEDLGFAKSRAVRAEHMLKHTEALLFKDAAGPVEQRKAVARTDQKYLEAAVEDAVAAGELHKLQALREAAAMRIEAWRSEQANYRAMKL